jgi:CRISPR-associated endonuclease Csn1
MEKVLGLDLGTNSIGWAIREIDNSLENQIIDKGVLTFDKGVSEDKSGEHPMVQKRTESRGKRRNYQAEKYRKWHLLECLIENKMCPLQMEDLNAWRHYKKGQGRKYPLDEKFIQWLRFDFDGDGKPDFERFGFNKHESLYIFRVLIVDSSKKEIFINEPQIIGRVLYQLVQRRGFNDDQNIDEIEKDELSKTIMKGGGESGALGVNQIQPFVKEHKTLGAALYYSQKEQNTRIRKRYNLRSHYESELREICNIQQINHLYNILWASIIWQRPLRGQKGLVGTCTFEQNKSRCPVSHPLYEEYRTWVFINNLKIEPIDNDLFESDSEWQRQLKQVLKEKVYPQFFKAASDFKLSSITKELKKLGYQVTAKFPEDTKVKSLSFLYKMKEIFGEDWASIIKWNELIAGTPKSRKYNIDDLWHLHFNKSDNKLSNETSSTYLQRFAKEKLLLSDTKAEEFSKIKLRQGYATLSKNAIKKILPYLQEGFIYSEAIYLANLHKVLGIRNLSQDVVTHFSEEVRRLTKYHSREKKQIQVVNELISNQLNGDTRFGMDTSYELDDDDNNDIETKIIEVFGRRTWDNLNKDSREEVTKYVSNSYLAFLRKRIHEKGAYVKPSRFHDKVFNWIKDTYNIPDENKKFLWHPSEQEIYLPSIKKDGKEFLGSPEPTSKGFKNPMAMKTLHKLKKLINFLIAVGKIDSDTRVVIEIARELNDTNKRKAIERWQKDREKENESYKKRIDEINELGNSNFNREDKNLINKIRLWEEQNRRCIYTGTTINLSEILVGSKYDFEHTIPASMSFDNELKNLTIADKKYNQQIKGKRLPSECPNYETEISIDATNYPPILSTLQSVFGRLSETEVKINGKNIIKRSFEKIVELEKLFVEWKSKTSDDKTIKDNIIIKRHYIKMDLDYWRQKLNSFIITEYKSGWKNSQLRDTQTVTKYALPYLKTVFNKVEVQKGSITADFRKIFQIQHRLEKKERTKHSHHAIDAAVLTLIPTPALRDKILLQYNEAQEIQQNFHEKPRQWTKFQTHHILSIENDVLINYQAQDRTLTPTYKTVRKRGKIQFVKEKLPSGKWQYRLNKEGKKIPLIAKGDSIRGRLHKESFFGAIQINGELSLVERYPISSFTSINDCKNIVDKAVRKHIEETLTNRIAAGMSFDMAKSEPISFPNNKVLIKKVRCKVAAGRGYLTPEKALEIRTHTLASKTSYKQYLYAQSDQNSYCLYYENEENGKRQRAFRIVGLFELSKLGLNKDSDLYLDSFYNNYEVGKGNKKIILPLISIIKVGTKLIFVKDHIEELKELSKDDLLKRIFNVYKFNMPSSSYVYCQNHVEARDNDILGNGDTEIKFENYQPRVFLSASKFSAAIEGKEFSIKPDGEVIWLF